MKSPTTRSRARPSGPALGVVEQADDRLAEQLGAHGGTTMPASATASGTPPTPVAAAGRPHAIASMSGLGKPREMLGVDRDLGVPCRRRR